MRGACGGSDSVCYAPAAAVRLPPTADAAASTIQVPFSAFTGGSPNAKLDPSTLITVQWQLSAPNASTACAANFAVENVAFY